MGELVLAVKRSIILNKRIDDKFTSIWDGQYDVKEAYSSGAYKIIDQYGVRVRSNQWQVPEAILSMKVGCAP